MAIREPASICRKERVRTDSGVGTSTNANDATSRTTGVGYVKSPGSKGVIPTRSPTPVKITEFAKYLEGIDKGTYDYIVEGFTEGFRLGFKGERTTNDPPNLKSALGNPKITQAKIDKEVEAGRYAGPFSKRPIDGLTVSPIGLQPKKEQGEYRLITHLSYPKGNSINDGIAREHATVQYANITRAIKIVKQLGRGCYMAKTDIKSAFRIVPLNPDQYKLMGIKFNGKWYVDLCLAMGASSSCKIFEEISSAMEWVAKEKLNIYNTHIRRLSNNS